MKNHGRFSIFKWTFLAALSLGPTLHVVQGQGKNLPAQISQTTELSEALPVQSVNDAFLLLLKAVGVILVISAVLYGILRLYKRHYAGASPQPGKIRVLGSRMIAAKKSVCMVSVLDHVLVLGLTDTNVNLLLEIPVNELNEEIQHSLIDPVNQQEANFKNILQTVLTK